MQAPRVLISGSRNSVNEVDVPNFLEIGDATTAVPCVFARPRPIYELVIG